MDPIVTDYPDRAAWLDARRGGVGASDVPCLAGVSNWKGAADVYFSKIDSPADRPSDGVARLGQELEPALCVRYAEVMGVDMTPCGYQIARHPDRTWQMCSPDFRRSDGYYVQGKTLCGFGDEWGPGGSDIVPTDYRLQVMQEMGVTGTDRIDLAALCRISGEFRVYRLRFDQALFDWITEIGQQFWSLVEARMVPPAGWSEQFAPQALALRTDVRPVLGDDVAELCNRLKVFSALKAEAEREYESVRDALKAAMGDLAEARAGEWKIKQQQVPGSTVTRTVTTKPYSKVTVSKLKERITS